MSQADMNEDIHEAETLPPPPPDKPQGFAALLQTPEGRAKHREWASLGGRTAHAEGTAHRWTPEEAKEHGRRGGLSTAAKRRGRGQ